MFFSIVADFGVWVTKIRTVKGDTTTKKILY